eukprot:3708746-Rhodomonas_salina.5
MGRVVHVMPPRRQLHEALAPAAHVRRRPCQPARRPAVAAPAAGRVHPLEEDAKEDGGGENEKVADREREESRVRVGGGGEERESQEAARRRKRRRRRRRRRRKERRGRKKGACRGREGC